MKQLDNFNRIIQSVVKYFQEAKFICDPLKATTNFDILVTIIESLDLLPQFFALHSRQLSYEAKRKITFSSAPSTSVAQISPSSASHTIMRDIFRDRTPKFFFVVDNAISTVITI